MENLETLLDQAIEASNQGDKDLAISIYQKILSEKDDWATVHYNLGLIYKYRNEWDKSYQRHFLSGLGGGRDARLDNVC